MTGHMCFPLPLQVIDQIMRGKQEPTMNMVCNMLKSEEQSCHFFLKITSLLKKILYPLHVSAASLYKRTEMSFFVVLVPLVTIFNEIMG